MAEAAYSTESGSEQPLRSALARECDSEDEQRYAEDLTDTEGKVRAIRRLSFFDEFDQKPEPEDGDEEEAE